ncbi:MAG: YrhB domain-containing protein [Chryseobacterium sp.]|jgi:hypothetical protein|uniref:YrhB domain-containing protein n=1 Tax=Chryseobacterium sp. TaxID=1871047 RepID=UPI00281CED77|nr:YrhB domain-containing protein [Chryseobacterium sp.]MDR2237386.1 YrhB domain-containing protein [Chryseobacterium sp.]
MLTDKDMLAIAERYLKKKENGKDIEIIIYPDGIMKKSYGNIYHYNSKEYILTGNFNKSLVGNAPFLVEKKTGRVVNFGTAAGLEDYIKSYEDGTLGLCLTTYWYPDEDRFDYK